MSESYMFKITWSGRSLSKIMAIKKRIKYFTNYKDHCTRNSWEVSINCVPSALITQVCRCLPAVRPTSSGCTHLWRPAFKEPRRKDLKVQERDTWAAWLARRADVNLFHPRSGGKRISQMQTRPRRITERSQRGGSPIVPRRWFIHLRAVARL